MLGGDQYNNSLSRNTIIKCHECGDTNLRYLGDGTEKPYVCGNKHKTWGAIDDWSIKGQTDNIAQNVNDCCCEGVACDFPESIRVDFQGLIGVQAREAGTLYDPENGVWMDHLTYDLTSRFPMPFSMCPDCICSSFSTTEGNSPWYFNCGGSRAEFDCKFSDDNTRIRNLDGLAVNCTNSTETDALGRCLSTTSQGISISFQAPGECSPPPGGGGELPDPDEGGGGELPDPDEGGGFLAMPPDTDDTEEELFGRPACSFKITVGGTAGCCASAGQNWTESIYAAGGSFFEPGYPMKYKDLMGGPSFFAKVAGGLVLCDNCSYWEPVPVVSRPGEGSLLDNMGSVYFLRTWGQRTRSVYNSFGFNCGCCVSYEEKHYLVYRTHPTADNNALSGWSITQEGIHDAFKHIKVFKTFGTCASCTEEYPGVCPPPPMNTDWFCNTSNQFEDCTDCSGFPNVEFDDIKLSPRSIWPWRIPAYDSYGIGPTNEQLIRNGNTFSGAGFIRRGECGCRDKDFGAIPPVSPTCSDCPEVIPPLDPPDPVDPDPFACQELTRDDCDDPVYYPSCLSRGTLKCSDVDAKYRVACSNPTDYMRISMVQAKDLFIDSRKSYTIQGGYWCGFWQVSVKIHPRWVDRVTGPSGQEYEIFVFPEHPACGTPKPGVVSGYGPNLAPADVAAVGYAQGVRGPLLSQLVADKYSAVDQPHCLRRVINPNFAGSPYYAVNTADLSEQTLILDRYYNTGNGNDYMWKDVPLAKNNQAVQPFVANAGDIGVSDYIEGHSFPYPFTAHSGSLEEPELVAIVHSLNGVGAQVAFSTFPVAYETDETVPIAYSQLKPRRGSCLYDHRVTAHGYGVTYPYPDDPMWSNDYDTAYQYPMILPGSGYALGDTIEFRCWKCLFDADKRGAVPFEEESIWKEECIETVIAQARVTELATYRVAPDSLGPVIEGDEDIDISDKTGNFYINFAVNKTLAVQEKNWEVYRIDVPRLDGEGAPIQLGNGKYLYRDLHFTNTGEDILFTQGQVIDVIFNPKFNDIDPESTNPRDWRIVAPSSRYRQGCGPTLMNGAYGVRLKVEGIIDEDGDGLGWADSFLIDEVLCCPEEMKDLTVPNPEEGEFYVLITNGGISWWEFDEEGISIGNCPCEWDICDNPDYESDPENFFPCAECQGCISKQCYPEIDDWRHLTHHSEDALPYGWPGFPNLGCVSYREYDENDQFVGLVPQVCYGPGSAICGQSCAYTYNCSYDCRVENLQIVCYINPQWILKYEDDCSYADNCACTNVQFPTDQPIDGVDPDPVAPNTKTYGSCTCSTYNGQFLPAGAPLTSYVGPFGRGDFEKCFPLNRTWEFCSANYAVSACAGEPYSEPVRPILDPATLKVIPPKRAQYRYEWLPKVTCLADQAESKEYSSDGVYGSIGCNPLLIDKYNHSYRFPGFDFNLGGGAPCRKTAASASSFPINNEPKSGGPPPEAMKWVDRKQETLGDSPTRPSVWKWKAPEGEDKPREIIVDDYCRVYGFYQQRQPSCEVVYRGQYILRAAQKAINGLRYTDCEPLIEDIEITLKQQEARIDISVGAPTDQDYIFPEQLPDPLVVDGKRVVIADAWNDPSLDGNTNYRFFDHGFFAPDRKAGIAYKFIEGESEDQNDLKPVVQINPTFEMYRIDGLDYNPDDGYLDDVWDLPDPRSVVRTTKPQWNEGQPTNPNPTYGQDWHDEHPEFPSAGERSSFIEACPYPWENNGCSDCDPYCMYKNYSAKLIVDSIKECEYCSSAEIVKYSKKDFVLVGKNPVMPMDKFHYTLNLGLVLEEFDSDGDGFNDSIHERMLLLRCYGSQDGKFDKGQIIDLINDYIQVWVDRNHPSELVENAGNTAEKLIASLVLDDNRRILCNYIFQGANNDKLDNLTKIEMYIYDCNYPMGFTSYNAYRDDVWSRLFAWPDLTINSLQLIHSEERCQFPKRGGGIESVLVQNAGSGYAFEVEERVAPKTVKQPLISALDGTTIEGLELTFHWRPHTDHGTKRRRETYELESVSVNDTLPPGSRGDSVYNALLFDPLTFVDSDARRDGVVHIEKPEIYISEINPETRQVLAIEVKEKGKVYKYVGTDTHKAYPIAIVINNYWNRPGEDGATIGRNAILKPVVGVDPNDPLTYGKIQQVKVEYHGVDYVAPTKYWTIDTKAGKFDSATGNLISGLDIQHLVDPSRHKINGNGLSPEAVLKYYNWTDTSPGGYFEPQDEYEAEDEEIIFPEKLSPPDNPFLYSTKYYYHTGCDLAGNVIKWEDEVKPWDTVISSGSCPFGKDGLLDRTYHMALVEDVDMTSQGYGRPYQPIIGNCNDYLCDQLINDPECVVPRNTLKPDIDSPYYDCQDLGCNVYTVYDAHRFPISYTNYLAVRPYESLASSWYARPRPYIQGCSKQHPIDNLQIEGESMRSYWCDVANTNGYVNLGVASNPNDKCYNCTYSLYAEFGKIPTATRILGLVRGKVITYEMNEPITMKISYNDAEFLSRLYSRDKCTY